MSLIKLLPQILVNQIAAGEVVERPASVVKELVENSLDAGATRVEIEVNEGGRSLVRVTDNGCGIAKEDLEIALQRHATSKIGKEADLWNIRTMGFRGEALASIASVSRMAIKSRREEDEAGAEIGCEGGDLKQLQEVGMSVGTQIEVADLFFNTPARQKYLKQDATELGRITALMNQIGLANPGIAFKLIHNGKVVFDWAKATDMISRIGDVLGGGVAEAMIPIFYGGSDMKVSGFVGKPLLSRSTSQHQYLLVNGRPIQDHAVAARVRAAYHSMLMEHKKPVFVINLEIDPGQIDVNVHPRKLEIRFEDQQKVLSVLYGATKAALETTNLIPRGYSESQRYMSDSFPSMSKNDGGGFSFPRPTATRQEAMSFSERIIGGLDQKPEEVIQFIAVAQVHNSYIVAKGPEGLVLIDQHAGHERVRYEELMREYKEKEKKVQPLLTPLRLELSNDEATLMAENLEIFSGIGFEIENFGGNSFVLQAVPSCLSGEDADQVVRGVLDDLQLGNVPSEVQGRIEEILTYTACRSAIKFGQSLSLDEMQSLLNQMQKVERPYTCPHGRPTMVSLSLEELGRMFGRK